MLLAVVTRLVDVKGGKILNLLSGYTETNSIHNRTASFCS
jgi:hypothetical protein